MHHLSVLLGWLPGLVVQAEAAQAEEGPSPQLRQLAADLRAAQLGAGAGAAFGLRRAAEWLQGSRGLAPGAAAAALGELQAAQLLTVADASAADQPITAGLLQGRPQLPLLLVADAPQPTRWKEPLNGQVVWFGLARPAAEVRSRGTHATQPRAETPLM